MLTIQVPAPENLHEVDRKFFPEHTYVVDPLRVCRLKNVLLSQDGLCTRRGVLQRESIHDYPGKLDFYFKAFRTAIAARITRRAPCMELDPSKTYVSIHHPWPNYYHWLLEYFPRLLLVEDELPSLSLIIPETLVEVSFVKATLAYFDFHEVVTLPPGVHAWIPNYVLPQLRPWGSRFDPNMIGSLRRVFLKEQSTNSSGDGRLYITRGSDSKRRIQNEDKVIQVCEQYGFEVVNFSEKTFLQQVDLCSSAKYIVGQHGAGLSNIIFAGSGCKVMELHKRLTVPGDFINDIYWHLANACGHSYWYQICEPADKHQHFVTSDVLVDTEALQKNIEGMLG